MPWQPRLAALCLLAALGGTDATAAMEDPGSVAGNFLAGNSALEAGDLTAAANYLDLALEEEPDDVELRRQVFTVQLAAGHYDLALATARELIKLDPQADEAALLLALEQVQKVDFTKAGESFKTLGDRTLAGTIGPVLQAWAELGRNNGQAATDLLAVVDRGQPLDRLRVYHRAVIEGLTGDPKSGLTVFDAEFPDQKMLPLRMLRARLQLLLEDGQRDAALESAKAVLAADPDNIPLQLWIDKLAKGQTDIGPIKDARTGIGDALLGLAGALDNDDTRQPQLVYTRMASFLMPGDPDAAILIARTNLAEDRPAAALVELEPLSTVPTHAWAANLLRVQALEDLDRNDEAAKVLEGMAAERPERTDALITLGDLYRRDERYAEAESAYTRAIARLPSPQEADWRVLYARGISYERTKRWPEAEADLKLALEIEPEQPFVLNYLGYSWVDQGLHLDEAKRMLNRAVELRPEDGFIVDSLGWAYYRLGDYPKAVEHLERAVELEPGDPVVNDHLGDAYWQVGRQREARFQWQRSLTLKPDSELETALRGKLDRGLSADTTTRG